MLITCVLGTNADLFATRLKTLALSLFGFLKTLWITPRVEGFCLMPLEPLIELECLMKVTVLLLVACLKTAKGSGIYKENLYL